jgi:hypothetical protein
MKCMKDLQVTNTGKRPEGDQHRKKLPVTGCNTGFVAHTMCSGNCD